MKYFLALISIILGAGAQYLLKVGMNSGIVYTNDIGNKFNLSKIVYIMI